MYTVKISFLNVNVCLLLEASWLSEFFETTADLETQSAWESLNISSAAVRSVVVSFTRTLKTKKKEKQQSYNLSISLRRNESSLFPKYAGFY